jgi:L-aspartate semialdehyde sulfurtransferase
LKTVAEINEKIKKGSVVVATAEEMTGIVREKGAKKAADKVDVVTTGTFAPMCSSGVFLNLGHSKPKMKFSKLWLNDVPAYCGIAAVDVYLGATELREGDPENKVFPGAFKYGGGHVIEDIAAGKNVRIRAESYGTNCYPLKEMKKTASIKDMPRAMLVSPRNCYQNYNAAVNKSDKIIYTYMGVLRPGFGNANYCSAGQLSPLFNDPLYRTIGVGTRIFLGGGIGYVFSHGTQHSPDAPRSKSQIPVRPAGTLALTGDLKGMSSAWLRGASMTGYGATLTVGVGVPIPVLDEEMAEFTSVRDEDITTCVVDYSHDYPEGKGDIICETNYGRLRSGSIRIGGKDVPAGSLSSYHKAVEIADGLKNWILKGGFFLTEAVDYLPGAKQND